jgi:hypothetical protein
VQIGLASSVLHFEFSSSEQRKYRLNHAKFALLIGVVFFWNLSSFSRGDLLIADRLTYSVYRYSDTGAYINTVVDHSLDIYQATGIALSPNFKQLYVSSSLGRKVMEYDYDAATASVSNPRVFADASNGLTFPNDIRFSPDGNTIYVANLSSSSGGVFQFDAQGNSAGPKLQLSVTDPDHSYSGPFQASSMSFFKGKLLVGVFQNSDGGGIAISDSSVSTFPDYLVPSRTEIDGATGLMIHDGYLYVSGLYASQIRRFQLCDSASNNSCNESLNGQMDESWMITDLPFPQKLMESPDGNGFLAGILGNSAGAGQIAHYGFDGQLLGTFADHAGPGQNGFTEATAFVFVPTVAPGIIGDFNNDGRVDAADYVVWRKASPTTTLPNDDTPGVVDASDYTDWRANFGKSTAASGAALGANTVPEPALGLLLVIAIFAGSVVRHRK